MRFLLYRFLADRLINLAARDIGVPVAVNMYLPTLQARLAKATRNGDLDWNAVMAQHLTSCESESECDSEGDAEDDNSDHEWPDSAKTHSSASAEDSDEAATNRSVAAFMGSRHANLLQRKPQTSISSPQPEATANEAAGSSHASSQSSSEVKPVASPRHSQQAAPEATPNEPAGSSHAGTHLSIHGIIDSKPVTGPSHVESKPGSGAEPGRDFARVLPGSNGAAHADLQNGVPIQDSPGHASARDFQSPIATLQAGGLRPSESNPHEPANPVVASVLQAAQEVLDHYRSARSADCGPEEAAGTEMRGPDRPPDLEHCDSPADVKRSALMLWPFMDAEGREGSIGAPEKKVHLKVGWLSHHRCFCLAASSLRVA